MSPEWVSVTVSIIVMVSGVIWTVYTVQSGNEKMVNKISTGQEVAKVREENNRLDIIDIKSDIREIKEAENRCSKELRERIASLESHAKSMQNELTEEKNNRAAHTK